VLSSAAGFPRRCTKKPTRAGEAGRFWSPAWNSLWFLTQDYQRLPAPAITNFLPRCMGFIVRAM
jgi:hypothetical protein